MTKNTNTVLASAAIRKAYNAAKAAESKSYGAFVGFITETAKANFAGPITVAAFATFVGDDLSVGKEVSAEDKAERNRIRARIRYGLEQAGMLEEKTRKPQAAGSKAKAKTKTKGEAAADAVENADETAQTNPKDRFAAVCSILRAMGRQELLRVANELAVMIATKDKDEAQPETPAKPQKRKAASA